MPTLRRSRSSSRPQSAAARRRISPAALRVNVRARTREGDTPSTSTRCAMRAVSACVLPVPAAAKTSSGEPRCSATWRCASFRPSRIVAAAIIIVVSPLSSCDPNALCDGGTHPRSVERV